MKRTFEWVKMERIFLTWSPFASRSDLLAGSFNAKSYRISYLSKKTLLHTVLRYCAASFHTLYILLSEKPKIVFLINQPVFLPIVVCIYCRIRRSHYILDSHSGLLNKRVWRTFVPLMKIIYRGCSLNIAHNEHDAQIYRSWGAKTAILGTEYYSHSDFKKLKLNTERNVVVIAVFGADEPIQEVLAAAAELSDVSFYITGPIQNARKLGITNHPPNVTLTGFLPRDEFVGLIMAADAAMVLVTTDNTMQMGAWEALSCQTPLIISNWPILRNTFPKGAIFVDNSKSGITNGVRAFFRNKDQLKREIVQLREEKLSVWKGEVDRVRNFIDCL